MFFAGIDAHTRYVVVVIINRMGERVAGPTRVKVSQPERLLELLAAYRPLEAIVETSSSWPWLHELLSGAGVQFVLAHARRLRAIAEANYKRDDIDAELLARMRSPGSFPRCIRRRSRSASGPRSFAIGRHSSRSARPS